MEWLDGSVQGWVDKFIFEKGPMAQSKPSIIGAFSLLSLQSQKMLSCVKMG